MGSPSIWPNTIQSTKQHANCPPYCRQLPRKAKLLLLLQQPQQPVQREGRMMLTKPGQRTMTRVQPTGSGGRQQALAKLDRNEQSSTWMRLGLGQQVVVEQR